MRVVFMSATQEVWGAEVSMLTLAGALQERGVAVAVVCLPGELAEQAKAAGHEVLEASTRQLGSALLEASALWRTYARHVREGDRLVLFSYILVAWAPLFRRRLSAHGVRITLDLHDQLESRKAFWSVRATSEAVDTVVACSEFTARQMGGREDVYALHRPVVLAPAVQQRATRLIAERVAMLGVPSDAPTRSAASAESGAPTATVAASAANGHADGVEGDNQGTRAQRAGVVRAGAGVRRPDHVSHDRRARSGARAHADFGHSGPEPSSPATAGEPGGRARAGEPMRIGIVGRISPEKRHELVVEAIRLLHRDAELVVRGSAFGDAADYAERVDRAGAHALGARYVNQGRVPADEALVNLDVVVVGNPAEPMGRTVLEAQLQGVIAVVPDSGGSSELVEDGRTGLVYAADDAHDLARVLARIFDEPQLAAAIIRDAVSTVPQPAEYAAAYLSRLG